MNFLSRQDRRTNALYRVLCQCNVLCIIPIVISNVLYVLQNRKIGKTYTYDVGPNNQTILSIYDSIYLSNQRFLQRIRMQKITSRNCVQVE